METFNFSDRDATVDKLQELGVLDRLKKMSRIVEVTANLHDFHSYDENSVKGHSRYYLVRSVMDRVTYTGDYHNAGVDFDTQLAALRQGLPPGAHGFIPNEPTGDIYKRSQYRNVPYWEVKDFCSLIIQSANRFRGVQSIRWQRSTKQTIVAETQHYVGEDALFSPEDFDLDGFETSVPMHLPALVVAYNISPEGELLETVVGIPTPVHSKSDTPWLWTYDILAHPDSNIQKATPAPISPVPHEQVPDVELHFKREATHE
ncbi:hypothetical protein CRM92_08970 [Rothia dentocariosa]|jgi:hypothetical protein|uniref:Uncharacterized protein n=1 Tax=Rothia dentocariosa TaxID=2047 RepID=A0A2A8D544_9MICC|nr:hypothetical protein [Rothia dentocariosa]PEN15728.1 hypothetical protein CRM92_08970 [Rothia dentocariosa]